VNYTEWKRSKDTKGCFAVSASGKVDYACDCDCEPDDAQVLHWVLQSIKEDFVKKDPTWLPTVLPKLRDFWSEVVVHRTNGTKPEEIKKLPILDL
jgi:hypothetical protein